MKSLELSITRDSFSKPIITIRNKDEMIEIMRRLNTGVDKSLFEKLENFIEIKYPA